MQLIIAITRYNIMQEEWKDVRGFEGYYQISNLGRVKSVERVVKKKNGTLMKVSEKIRVLSQTTDNYSYVVLAKNGKNKTFLVHRLVAETFIGNPNNLPCVNHKDENKQNDCVDNLEWCTYEYNNTYKNIHLRRCQDNIRRMVIQYDLDMHEIKRWDSIIEAAKFYNIQSANISACCMYRRNHCAGFKWRYFI